MKTILTSLILAASFSAICAQELLPELRTAVLKRQGDIAELEDRKTFMLGRARHHYISALTAAEAKATAAGHIPIIVALNRDLEALRAGTLKGAFPAELPKSLQTIRKACMDAETKLAIDAAADRQRLDAAHLRTLAALQPRAALNPVLAEQLAAEKSATLGTAIAAKPPVVKPVTAEAVQPRVAAQRPASKATQPNGLIGSTWDYRGGALQLIRFIDEANVERWMTATATRKEHGTYRMKDDSTVEITMDGEGMAIVCKLSADLSTYDAVATDNGTTPIPQKLWKYVGMKFAGARLK